MRVFLACPILLPVPGIGGQVGFVGRSLLPVVPRSGRHIWRRPGPLTRIASPELGKWITLPDQTGQLGEWISAPRLLARPRRLRRLIGIVGSIGSERVIVRHTHSVSGAGVALGRLRGGPR